MDDLIARGATDLAAGYATGRFSVADVTRAHLDRVAAREPALRAVVEPMEEAAIARAESLDAIPKADRGPLFGLPITVKINVDLTGFPNSNGIPALNTNPATRTSPQIANLIDAGAVVIGRTNAPEFSLRWFTSNPIYGVTANPAAPDRTPGGSSGGASAAVAAGMGVLGHGNDLGGSLRYPAYCTGTISLRPSLGRVPAFNPSAPSERPAALQMMSVQGLIARNAADLALGLAPMMAKSPRDPLWNAAADSGRARTRPCRIRLVRDAFSDGKVAPCVGDALEGAARALAQAGHLLSEGPLPMAHAAAQTWGELLNAETKVMMEDLILKTGSAEVIAVLKAYEDILGVPDMAGYIAALARRLTIQRAWSEMFEDVDAVLMPVSGEPPYPAEHDFRAPAELGTILDAQRHMTIVNVTGFPGIAVPTGKAGGAPMGVQLVGAWRDDWLLIDLAAELEAALGLSLLPV